MRSYEQEGPLWRSIRGSGSCPRQPGPTASRIFEQFLLGGLSWALGRLEADITPNLDQVAPQANEFMRQ